MGQLPWGYPGMLGVETLPPWRCSTQQEWAQTSAHDILHHTWAEHAAKPRASRRGRLKTKRTAPRELAKGPGLPSRPATSVPTAHPHPNLRHWASLPEILTGSGLGHIQRTGPSWQQGGYIPPISPAVLWKVREGSNYRLQRKNSHMMWKGTEWEKSPNLCTSSTWFLHSSDRFPLPSGLHLSDYKMKGLYAVGLLCKTKKPQPFVT
jgi:hypothetical protein